MYEPIHIPSNSTPPLPLSPPPPGMLDKITGKTEVGSGFWGVSGSEFISRYFLQEIIDIENINKMNMFFSCL